MRPKTLLTQVLVANLLLIAAAVIAAWYASDPGNPGADSAVGIVLGAAVAATVGLNFSLLQRRFKPLEDLVLQMESADLGGSSPVDELPPLRGPEEVRRLEHSFREMLIRLELERRQGAIAALAAQERERSRVALDLHDEVNQSLTGLLLRLETLRRKAPPELAAELAETGAVAGRAMEELLTLARQLRPTTLDDLGLKAALATLSEEVGRRSGIETDFDGQGDFSPVSDEIQLVAYRVAQEALSNAVQHAHAERVRVRLHRRGYGLELWISDDGGGFDADSATGGLGIAGMRERALLVGGKVEIDSGPNIGTQIRLMA